MLANVLPAKIEVTDRCDDHMETSGCLARLISSISPTMLYNKIIWLGSICVFCSLSHWLKLFFFSLSLHLKLSHGIIEVIVYRLFSHWIPGTEAVRVWGWISQWFFRNSEDFLSLACGFLWPRLFHVCLWEGMVEKDVLWIGGDHWRVNAHPVLHLLENTI